MGAFAQVSNTKSSLDLIPFVSVSAKRSEVTRSWRPKLIWVGAVIWASWATASWAITAFDWRMKASRGCFGRFGPVWTTLYLMMAFAVWRILRLPEASAERRWALGLFIAQLALNAAWSWMFFAANNPLLGLINIVPQILVILATIVAFYRLDRIAGWCLVPLAAWVSFATVLNFAIWKLNP